MSSTSRSSIKWPNQTRCRIPEREVMGEAKIHCEVIVVGAGHEEGTVRYFVCNGGTPKFIGIIQDVAAKGYQEIEFRSGSGANVQAATASAPT